MTTLVLLPGMDGTGDLFAPFVNAVHLRVQIIRYPTARPLDYVGLKALVRAELPTNEPYVLLGESFSGPIALSIASERPQQLQGVVLCCSFAKNPRPGLGALRGLVNLLPERPPMKILETLLCGRFATPGTRAALSRAMCQVSPAALRARLRAVISVDAVAELRAIKVPLLYLRAAEDRVVPSAASRLVLANAASASCVELVAPHFLLQTVPEEAARVVEEFVDRVAHAL
ncbi:MAG TPA: alpha/beta fold hydrolase [Ramlibacter sp.]